MANDRLWLGCPKCGNKIMLWKHYPGQSAPLAGYTPTETTFGTLDDFFVKHLECVDKLYAMSFGPEGCGLELWTEHSAPKKMWERHAEIMKENGNS